MSPTRENASSPPAVNPDPDLTSLTTSIPAPPQQPSPSRIPEQSNGAGSFAPAASAQSLHASTLAIHADDSLRRVNDIAPPIHLSTTFHYPRDPAQLFSVRELREQEANGTLASTNGADQAHIYSRESTHNTTRLETLLTSLLLADSIVYSSGLAALHAIYLLLKPRRVAISGGYHGAHAVLNLHQRLHGLEIVSLFDEEALATLSAGDVVHVETPVNPTGEARNLDYFAAKARASGAFLVVDATFGPPGLQDPFKHGADLVMHSGTKYLGGHSDLLCGVLATKNDEWAKQLRLDRTVTGSVIGSLEAWLVIRSLRTLELRVSRASSNATDLVSWLEQLRLSKNSNPTSHLLSKVLHASLQPEAQSSEQDSWLKRQMPNGYGPVFAMIFKDPEHARRFPSYLSLFQHATSLGGVESLIEWRAMSDDMVEQGLVRVSVGIENVQDLKRDLETGFERMMGDQK